MKKPLLPLVLFLAVCLNSMVLAQQSPAQPLDSSRTHHRILKPDVGDIGFGIKANGLKGIIWENSFDSATFQFRKVQRSTVLRADLSISFESEKDSYKDVFSNGDYSYEEDASRQFSIGLAPGIEKHFPGTRRLDPYVGAALSLAYVGKLHTTQIDDQVDADGTYFKSEFKRTLPGGFGIGLDGFVGVNYYMASRISIGVEYGLGFTLLNTKGKPTNKTTVKVKSTPAGSETTTITENNDDRVNDRSIFFGNKGVAGMNLVFYLGR